MLLGDATLVLDVEELKSFRKKGFLVGCRWALLGKLVAEVVFEPAGVSGGQLTF